MEASELAERLAKHGCMLVGEFKLTSGLESPYYIDLRKVPSHPQLFDLVTDAYISLFTRQDIRFDRVAGIPTAGIPIATLVAYKLKKPFLYVRGGERTHGTQHLIEGVVEPGDVVLIVDDVATTGGNIQRAVTALRGAGAEVKHAAVLVDREQGAKERLEAMGVRLLAFLTTLELARELRSKGIISERDYQKIVDHVKEGKLV